MLKQICNATCTKWEAAEGENENVIVAANLKRSIFSIPSLKKIEQLTDIINPALVFRETFRLF